MTLLRHLGLAALLLLSLPSLAFATTRYVDASAANDNATCAQSTSISTPKKLLSSAAACMSGGDTLFVRTGTYAAGLNNAFPAGSAGAYTLVAAYDPGGGPEAVTFTCASQSWVLHFTGNTQHHIEIRNINLNATSCAEDGVKIDGTDPNTAHHIRIVGGSIFNAVGQGILLSQGSTFNEFRGINIFNNGLFPGAEGFNHGIYVGGGSDNIIENNTFDHPKGYCVHVYHDTPRNNHRNIVRNNVMKNCATDPGAQQWAIILGSGDANQAYNNVIYSSAGCVLVDQNNPTNTLVANNTCVDSSSGSGRAIENRGSGTRIVNNLAVNTNGISFGSATNETNLVVSTFTGFVNAGAKNYRLTSAATTAINLGTTVSDFSTDFDLASRPSPVGGNWDIGAFEFGAGPGGPVTRYVSVTGSASTNCTTDDGAALTGRCSILQAASIVASGDTVLVHAGTYVLTQTIILASPNVSLRAFGDGTVILSFSGTTTDGFTFTGPTKHHYTIENLTLEGNSSARTAVASVNAEGSGNSPTDITFRNVTIHNWLNSCVAFNGNPQRLLFESVTVDGCDPTAATGGLAHGYNIRHFDGLTIRDGSVTRAGGRGILLFNNTPPEASLPSANLLIERVRVTGNGDGILVDDCDVNCILRNLLVYKNDRVGGGNGGGIMVGAQSAGVTIQNCTIHGNPGPFAAGFENLSAATVVTNIISQGNNVDCAGTCTGFTTSLIGGAAVTFINPSTGDYRLATPSTMAINQGTTIAAVTVDFYGTSRPQAGSYDIGAAEGDAGAAQTGAASHRGRLRHR